MRALDEGEEFIVTRNGVSAGELPPVRRLVPTKSLLDAMQDIPPIEPERFRADVDAVLDQTINPQA